MTQFDYGTLQELQVPLTAGEVGLVALGVGITLGASYLTRIFWKWRDARLALEAERSRKALRLQEAMGNRQNRLKELVTEMICDGLFEAEFAGKISEQEMKKLYKEFSEKMELPELVPTKTRSKIIKQEIKARRAKGFYLVRNKIPGPKPGEAPVGVVKRLVSKYWRAKPASA